jgi:hypothetical protein
MASAVPPNQVVLTAFVELKRLSTIWSAPSPCSSAQLLRIDLHYRQTSAEYPFVLDLEASNRLDYMLVLPCMYPQREVP